MKKQSLEKLLGTLRKADAQYSKALDDRDRFDSGGSKRAESRASKAEGDAIGRAESKGSEAVDDALLALCKYRPKTQNELCRYVRTLFEHERIQRGTLDHGPDRLCAAAMLASINASVVSILFRDFIPVNQRD